MKKLIFKLILVLSLLTLWAQTPEPSIQVTSEWSSSIPDVRDLIAIENIEYQKIKFSSEALVGKNYALRALEIWDGEVRDSAMLTNSVTTKKPITDSTFEVRVISKINDQKNY